MKKVLFYLALIFLILELAYINTLSLRYLIERNGLIDKIFSIIGATSFSMITILVMRTPNMKWLKLVFPLFDCLLFLFALNVRFSDHLFANPVAFGLTFLFAAFAGIITYSSGVIDINKSNTDLALEELKDKLVSSNNEIEKLQYELAARQKQIDLLNSQSDDNKSLANKYKTDSDILRSQLKGLESDLLKYRQSHLLYEKSRILKKKLSNRTPEDIQTLEDAGKYLLI